MLEAAGIDFTIQPSRIDEDAIKNEVLTGSADVSPTILASRLAAEKAQAVSRADPTALVIGSDQVLEIDGELLSKPADLSKGRAQLQRLRGATHTLVSAAALASSGKVVWQTSETAALTMRMFSDAFLETYIDNEADLICQSVGGYRIEGPGIHLFEKIKGDYFVILGMPLLGLLEELRRQGVIAT